MKPKSMHEAVENAIERSIADLAALRKLSKKDANRFADDVCLVTKFLIGHIGTISGPQERFLSLSSAIGYVQELVRKEIVTTYGQATYDATQEVGLKMSKELDDIAAAMRAAYGN